MTYLATVAELVTDPCISYWLKDALQVLVNRDVVDAASDAAILNEVMQRRVKEVLGE